MALRALAARYEIRKPPYAQGSPFRHVLSKQASHRGADYVKNILVDEKQHPYTGTKYAWVRARLLGGKTNIWGRLALRLSDYDFKGKMTRFAILSKASRL
jgi:choline dehydrogenase-like flavoprotein